MWSQVGAERASREGPRRDEPAVEMIRHLRRAGKGEVVVSVPRAWVRQSGLVIGSRLKVQEAGPGRLIIEDAQAGSVPWEASFESGLRSPLEHLFRCLVAAYLAGTPEIVVELPSSPSPEVRRTIREFARRTGRMEIVVEGERTVTLRDISGDPPLEADAVVTRMARQVLELHRRAGASLEGGAPALGEAAWENQDDEIDRLGWRIQRALASQLLRFPARHLSPEGSRGYLHLLSMSKALERVGDHAVRIGTTANLLPQTPQQLPKLRAVAEFHRQAVALLERVVPLIEHPDAVRANELVDEAESLHASHAALLQSLLSRPGSSALSPLVAGRVALVLDSIDRTVAYVADIAELALDRAAMSWARPRPPVSPVPVPVARPERAPYLSSRKGGHEP